MDLLTVSKEEYEVQIFYLQDKTVKLTEYYR